MSSPTQSAVRSLMNSFIGRYLDTLLTDDPKAFTFNNESDHQVTMRLTKSKEFYFGDGATRIRIDPGAEWTYFTNGPDHLSVGFNPAPNQTEGPEVVSYAFEMGNYTPSMDQLSHIENLQLPSRDGKLFTSVPLLEAFDAGYPNLSKEGKFLKVKADVDLTIRSSGEPIKLDAESIWENIHGEEGHEPGEEGQRYRHHWGLYTGALGAELSDITELGYIVGEEPEDEVRARYEKDLYVPMDTFVDTCIQRGSSYFTQGSTRERLEVAKDFSARLGCNSASPTVTIPKGMYWARVADGTEVPPEALLEIAGDNDGLLDSCAVWVARADWEEICVRIGDIEKMLSETHADESETLATRVAMLGMQDI